MPRVILSAPGAAHLGHTLAYACVPMRKAHELAFGPLRSPHAGCGATFFTVAASHSGSAPSRGRVTLDHSTAQTPTAVPGRKRRWSKRTVLLTWTSCGMKTAAWPHTAADSGNLRPRPSTRGAIGLMRSQGWHMFVVLGAIVLAFTRIDLPPLAPTVSLRWCFTLASAVEGWIGETVAASFPRLTCPRLSGGIRDRCSAEARRRVSPRRCASACRSKAVPRSSSRNSRDTGKSCGPGRTRS